MYATVSTTLLAGCASKLPAPRAAVVLEQRNAANGFERTMAAVASARSAVLGGLVRHEQGGGSLSPRSVGPAVGGLVDDGKAGVEDSCTQQVRIRYEDDGRQVLVSARCNSTYTSGQRVMVVFEAGKMDVRDAVRLVPVE
ncbi:MAG: hypothetical protein ABW190_04590 [Rhizobacter sp.]